MPITFFSLNTSGTKDSSSFQVCPFPWSFAEVKQLKISFFFVLGTFDISLDQSGFRSPEVCDGVTFAIFPVFDGRASSFSFWHVKKLVIILLIFLLPRKRYYKQITCFCSFFSIMFDVKDEEPDKKNMTGFAHSIVHMVLQG